LRLDEPLLVYVTVCGALVAGGVATKLSDVGNRLKLEIPVTVLVVVPVAGAKLASPGYVAVKV
jgi:hypothetical protein